MGQKLFEDKIGTVNYSGGNIVMSASITSPAYLTIGGQQYKITTALSAAANLNQAASRYQVYVVLSAGVPTMVISTNENSQGPTGYAQWKLIASYFSNGKNTIGFGSFADINSRPKTGLMEYDLQITATTSNPSKGTTTPGYDKATFEIDGEILRLKYDFYNAGGAGSAGSGLYLFSMPGALTFDSIKRISVGNQVQPVIGYAEANNGSSNGTGYVTLYDTAHMMLNVTSVGQPQTVAVSSGNYALVVVTTYSFNAEFAAVGLTNTPIKDL